LQRLKHYFDLRSMEEHLHTLVSTFSTQTINALETVQVQEIFGETDENKRKRMEIQEQLALLEGGLSRLELLEYNSPSDDDDERTASEDDEL
jgi:hypothetical protein